MIDIDHYRRRLLALERSVSARTNRAVAAGSLAREAARDAGDASHADEVSSESFAEAELSGSTLAQIRAALVRLDAGTFGACVVDGAPISSRGWSRCPGPRTASCMPRQAEGDGNRCLRCSGAGRRHTATQAPRAAALHSAPRTVSPTPGGLMQLGMIGLGRMGGNMVRRLLRAGHECVVFDVSAGAVAALAAEGATGTRVAGRLRRRRCGRRAPCG